MLKDAMQQDRQIALCSICVCAVKLNGQLTWTWILSQLYIYSSTCNKESYSYLFPQLYCMTLRQRYR